MLIHVVGITCPLFWISFSYFRRIIVDWFYHLPPCQFDSSKPLVIPITFWVWSIGAKCPHFLLTFTYGWTVLGQSQSQTCPCYYHQWVPRPCICTSQWLGTLRITHNQGISPNINNCPFHTLQKSRSLRSAFEDRPNGTPREARIMSQIQLQKRGVGVVFFSQTSLDF